MSLFIKQFSFTKISLEINLHFFFKQKYFFANDTYIPNILCTRGVMHYYIEGQIFLLKTKLKIITLLVVIVVLTCKDI